MREEGEQPQALVVVAGVPVPNKACSHSADTQNIG
jgi:hypothetical protein